MHLPYTLSVIGMTLLYFAASLLYQGVFWQHESLAGRARACLVAGLVLHALSFVFRATLMRQVPLTGRVEALSFFSMCLVGAFLFLSTRYRMDAAGPFLAPFVFLIGVCTYVNTRSIPTPAHLESKWLAVHVPIILLSFATFAVAFIGAVIYMVQAQCLKRRELSRVARLLPPLNAADELVYKMIVLGFPLFTLGIITGVMWAHSRPEPSPPSADPKVFLSMATWLLYLAYIIIRGIGGWRGKRINLLIVLGFFLVCVTFFGVTHKLSLL